jgi:phosphoserine aminotransferase
VNARAWNFSPGPGALPLPVLEQVRDELVELPGAGASILEISHRSDAFERVIEEAEANLRELLSIPDTHRVLFLQGGASLQFAMVPMNLLLSGADYVVTGSWGKKAFAEAAMRGHARVVWDGVDTGFTAVPDSLDGLGSPKADYLHVTSNETIEGVEFPSEFEPVGGPPLVCDTSSDFLSRPIPIERYGLLYAGAQKNAGPAGLTVVVIRDDLLETIPRGVPTMLDYRTFAEHGSLYNTPPVFAISVLMLVTRWLRDTIGGLDAMAKLNEEKAATLYAAIDGSDGFYRGVAAPDSRSRMNVTFRLPNEELERAFVRQAAGERLLELGGHRSVGGIRASIYNAMPIEGVQALTDFMELFRAARTP